MGHLRCGKRKEGRASAPYECLLCPCWALCQSLNRAVRLVRRCVVASWHSVPYSVQAEPAERLITPITYTHDSPDSPEKAVLPGADKRRRAVFVGCLNAM